MTAILATTVFAISAAVSLWVIGWGLAHAFAFVAMLIREGDA